MSLTVGSWWQSRDTGQRMTVSHRFSNMHGIDKVRFPCVLEGRGLHVVWLTEREVRAGFKHFRPCVNHPEPVPGWILNRQQNDVLFEMPDEPPLWLAISGIKSGWILLSGLVAGFRVQTVFEKGAETAAMHTGIVQPFSWGLQRYDSFFLPLADALPRIRPRFGQLDAWDRLATRTLL